MSKRVNPFSKNERGLKLYQQLKLDSEAKSDNIFTSLSLFIRIVLLESSSWRYEQFNKYDLLNPFIVSENFPQFITLSSEISYCKDIKYVQGNCKPKYIKYNDFLCENFLVIRGIKYTVQDFVFSIAYNGSIHMDPSSEVEHEKYIRIYANFVEKYSDLAFNLLLDIASCFVQSFHEVYENFAGSKHLMSPEHHHQPMIFDGSKREIVKASNEPVTYFSDAYSQVAIDKIKGSGIRLCLHLKLPENLGSDKHYIFCYGNLKNSHAIRITCYSAHNRIFVAAKRKSSGKSKQIIIPIEDFMVNDLFWLEVALYPKGFLVVAVNEIMKKHEDIDGSFSIYDGKVIVGASLEGDKFGKLFLSKLLLESIDQSEYTNVLRIFALSRVQASGRRNLSHMLIKRPINVIF
jgi:hypothetical protein